MRSSELNKDLFL